MSQALIDIASASTVRCLMTHPPTIPRVVRWEKPSCWQDSGQLAGMSLLAVVVGVSAWGVSGSFYLGVLAVIFVLLAAWRAFVPERFQLDETGIHWWWGARCHRHIPWHRVVACRIEPEGLYVFLRRGGLQPAIVLPSCGRSADVYDFLEEIFPLIGRKAPPRPCLWQTPPALPVENPSSKFEVVRLAKTLATVVSLLIGVFSLLVGIYRR